MTVESVGQAAIGLQTIKIAENWQRIPRELRALKQWCIAGPSKRPLTVDGLPASVNDSTTWADFETTCKYAANQGLGIGFVQTSDDPFTCIDMDVKDTTSQDAMDRYLSIIEQFDSYTEYSQSGRGFHLWVEGKIGAGKRRDGVEVYSQARFMICTGNVVRDRPISHRQELLSSMISQMGQVETLSTELWGENCADWSVAARAVENSGELGRLFRGDWQGRYPSQSEADLALVTRLIPLTESPLECWLTFRLSRLGEREKAGRLSYAQSTISAAIQLYQSGSAQLAHGTELAEGLFWQGPSNNERHFRLLLDGDLERLPPLRWFVKRVIPDSGIGAIYGDSGTYKSFLTLDVLAHISNGNDWFGNRVKAAPAVYVPFEGQGGIPNRIKAWRLAQAALRNQPALFSVEPPDDVRSNIAVIVDPMNLREPADREKLVATLIENGWAGGVLCIDTLAHASNGIDENSSAMGEMLAIFRDLQNRLGGVILVIHHSGKDQTRGMRGWSGLHAAMDFVVECQHDKGAGRRDAQFVLTKVKDGATGTKFGFTMQIVELGFDEDGDPISSLIVVPREAMIDGQAALKPESERDQEDDDFVWQWVKHEVERGEYPSGRSLEGQRELQMAGERTMTQKRLRDAVSRLKAASRLVDSDGNAPSGNKYLVAC